MTDALVQKFHSIEREIAAEKGDFTLFGLFERDDVPDKWDLVISASWIGDNEKSALDYIVGKLRPKLEMAELLSLAQIVLLHPTDVFVRSVNAVRVPGNIAEFQNCVFNGMRITHAYILASNAAGSPIAQGGTSEAPQNKPAAAAKLGTSTP